MTSSAPFGAHGFTFRITSPVTDLVDAFDDVLIDLRIADGDRSPDHRIAIDPIGDDVRPAYRVSIDGEQVYERLIEGSVVSHVLMEVNRRVTASVWSTGSVALHASVVAGPAGAVVLAGASHSGKTTLAAALALVGSGRFTLLADEVCALDPTDLTVAPYPKPAALRAASEHLLAPRVDRLRHDGTRFEHDERFVPPRELGQPPIGPCPVTAVVLVRYEESNDQTAPPELSALGPVESLTRLMHLTLGTEGVATGTFRTIERLVRAVETHELRHSDALRSATRLAVLLDGDRPA